jgi:flagellar hook-basal body complex protein FliE
MSVFGGSLEGLISTQIQAPAVTLAPSADSTHAPFADLVTEAVGQVDLLERQARSSVEGLMSGTGVDVHEAMIATEKAEMGFELVLAVRNKALAAYQQVMGLQF